MDNNCRKKVEIFVVGAPKAGTSSLYYYLAEHPDVSMCVEKEPNYFTQEQTRNLYDSNSYQYNYKSLNTEDQYHDLFDGSGIYGEASVSYLYYSETASDIMQYNPDAKIVICLRDPVSRARSHHSMDKRLGFTEKELDCVFEKEALDSVEYQQYVSVGRYTEQIIRYQSCFPENQIKIMWFDDIKTKPEAVCEDLCVFLGINYYPTQLPHRNKAKFSDNAFVMYLYKFAPLRSALNKVLPAAGIEFVKKVLFRSTSTSTTFSSEENNRLYEFFHDDVCSLEKLTKRNLASWKKGLYE